MRFLHKWAYCSARHIQISNGKNHDNRRILYFGFQAIYGDVAKLLLIIGISIVLKSFLTTITVTIAFATLRMYAGGVHLNTEGKCAFTTVLLFIIPGTIISRVSMNQNVIMIILGIIIFLISFICLFKYAPKDCLNRPITCQCEIIRFKRNSIICLGILYLVSMFFILIKQTTITMAICSGTLLEIFTLIPIGYKVFNLIAPSSVQK